MTHHIPERNIKEKKILNVNSVFNNFKETPKYWYIYIKELLENIKALTLNHDDSLKFIHGKIGHVSRPLLKLSKVMEEEKQMAMEVYYPTNGGVNIIWTIHSAFGTSLHHTSKGRVFLTPW